MCNGQLNVLRDFNFHVDDESDRDARQFMELIHSQVLTHEKGHTLDLIITASLVVTAISAWISACRPITLY